MKISINIPLAINHIGGRSNNEDSIFPLLDKANQNDNLFLVCDGVGGNEKGEVASRITCDKIAEYFTQNPIEASNEAYIGEALKYAESAIDQYIEENPESKGMGTTLTLLHIHSQGVTIAHVGDSRVYHFRSDQIPFQTSDHSMVNDLLKAGVINEDQAKDHPRKNVISRAIQGSIVKATKADVKMISDIRPGDYFFLCSDGILENITDFEIGQFLILDKSNEEKSKMIQDRCEEAPNDNFSSYLIQIEDVEGAPIPINEETEVVADVIVDAEPDVIVEAVEAVDENLQKPKKVPKKVSIIDRLKKLSPFILIAVIIIFVGSFLLDGDEKDTKDNNPSIQAAERLKEEVNTLNAKKGEEQVKEAKNEQPETIVKDNVKSDPDSLSKTQSEQPNADSKLEEASIDTEVVEEIDNEVDSQIER